MNVQYPWGGAQTDAVWALAGVRKIPLGGWSGAATPLVIWRSDGTGTAQTWAQVVALIGTVPNVPIVCDLPGDVLTVPPGTYNLRGAFFEAPSVATQVDIEISNGALLRNLAGARGGITIVCHADTGTCLDFDVSAATTAVQFSLEENATLRNAGTGTAACNFGNGLFSTTLILFLSVAGSLQGGDAFPVFNVTNTFVAAIVTERAAQQPTGDGTVASTDAGSTLAYLHDGTMPVGAWATQAGFLGMVANAPFGNTGGFGPTALRPVALFQPRAPGLRYYDTDTGEQLYWDGATWVPFATLGPEPFPFRIDHSVNAARVDAPYSKRPVLRCQSGGNAAGGFNGGGVGNKAILGFPVASSAPLALLTSLEWTYLDRTNGNEPGLPVYSNLMLDLLGTGTDWRIAVIDPLAGPAGINNGSTVTNGDGSKTTTWTAAANWLLIVNGLTVGLPPAAPPFVPPDFSVVPLAPYGLPAAWQSCSWSVASILAAWPNCRFAVGATGDGGLPKSPNQTLPWLLITGDTSNNNERAWELSNVKFNGVPV